MNDRILLITPSRRLDTGHETVEETARAVWAAVRSVTCTEFYQGNQAGLSPALIFRVNSRELLGAEYVEYADDRYRILRTYRVDAQYTDLTCEKAGKAKSKGGTTNAI